MSVESELKLLRIKIEELVKKFDDNDNIIQIKSQSVRNIKKMSINEFFKKYNPINGNQRVLAVCYFLEFIDEISPFNKIDIDTIFDRGKMKKLKNINDAMNQNIKHGFIDEFVELKDDLKAWTITDTGTRFVESYFKKLKE